MIRSIRLTSFSQSIRVNPDCAKVDRALRRAMFSRRLDRHNFYRAAERSIHH
jgi:hypothetical protein